MDVSLRITSLFTSDRLRDLQGSDIVRLQGPFCRLALSRVGARCSIESNSESKPLRTIASMPGALVVRRQRPVCPSPSGAPKGQERISTDDRFEAFQWQTRATNSEI